MLYFSVPADFNIATLERLAELNNTYRDCQVNEVYGQITTGKLINSGRTSDVLPQIDMTELEKYVYKAKKIGIDFNYVLNPSCLGNYEFSKSGIKEVIALLKNISNIGVKSLTLTSPSLIEIALRTGLDFDIKASTICEINSVSKAEFYKKLGVKRMVVDADITREFAKLKNICDAFGDGVEIIANNICRKNCAYKMFHYNHEAHCTSQSQQTIRNYFANRCFLENTNSIDVFMKMSWIRPEDLHFYEKCGIKNYKIQGRQNIVSSDLIKSLQAYFEKKFNGNLYELLTLFSQNNSFMYYIENKYLDGFLDKFYMDSNFCNELCTECRHCYNFAKICMDEPKKQKMDSLIRRVFENQDHFDVNIKDCLSNYN